MPTSRGGWHTGSVAQWLSGLLAKQPTSGGNGPFGAWASQLALLLQSKVLLFAMSC